MSDSTSIEALPGPTGGNVKLGINEQKPVQVSTRPPQMQAPAPSPISENNQNSAQSMPFTPSQMDSSALDKVLTGINQAQAHGMTELPSRDIPMNTAQHTQDKQIKPNYLPNADKKHYIEEHDTYNSMVEKRKQKEQQQDRLDLIYDEFQLPILIMVLFFIFQLPFVQKKLISFFPTMFLKDGQMSISGYAVKTLLFGSSFYLLMKLINYSSEL